MINANKGRERGGKVMNGEERVIDRAEWLGEQIPKRNTKIDKSKNRNAYLEMMCSGRFTLDELVEIAREKGEKIGRSTFGLYISKISTKFFREQTHVEKMIAAGTLSKQIITLKELEDMIRYQRARIDSHSAVDDKSPIARREQSNDIKLMMELLERYDSKKAGRQGAKGLTPDEEEGKGVKSFEDYDAEEEREEILRIARIELEAEKSRKRAKREHLFDDKGK